jgi:hypothetical protein
MPGARVRLKRAVIQRQPEMNVPFLGHSIVSNRSVPQPYPNERSWMNLQPESSGAGFGDHPAAQARMRLPLYLKVRKDRRSTAIYSELDIPIIQSAHFRKGVRIAF